MEPTWLDIYLSAIQANGAMPLPGSSMAQQMPYAPPVIMDQGIMVRNEQAQDPQVENLNTLASTGVPFNG